MVMMNYQFGTRLGNSLATLIRMPDSRARAKSSGSAARSQYSETFVDYHASFGSDDSANDSGSDGEIGERDHGKKKPVTDF